MGEPTEEEVQRAAEALHSHANLSIITCRIMARIVISEMRAIEREKAENTPDWYKHAQSMAILSHMKVGSGT